MPTFILVKASAHSSTEERSAAQHAKYGLPVVRYGPWKVSTPVPAAHQRSRKP